MASYPASAASFTTKNSGDTIQGSHVNDLQAEIVAIETALVGAAGLAHDLKFVDATYDIGKTGATRPRDFFLSRNAVVGGTMLVTGVATFTAAPVFSTALTILGVVNAGSITNGFGSIDIGADALTAGAITGAAGVFSGTIKGATTIGVGNATPSASGSGVTFPAAINASTDVNTLDDYEEGTFTPACACGTSGTITLGTTDCRYEKIGKKVTFTLEINVTSVSLPVGRLSVTGLPFAITGRAPATCFMDSTNAYAGNLAAYGNGATAITIDRQDILGGDRITDVAAAVKANTFIAIGFTGFTD